MSLISDRNLHNQNNDFNKPRVFQNRRASLPKNFRGVKKEVLQQQTNMFIANMTIDELYTEILYEIIHNVGCDMNCQVNRDDLFTYLQDAFKVSNEKHRELLEYAEQKEAPDRLLNVEVIEAKDLRPKDSNGLSDPFITLFLASNTSHRYTTSVKSGTLNPVWEEHFALPVSNNTADDTLICEVWDFDPAETVKEKFGKLFEVKGVKGIRKLFKEIAVTAATGQHENELIGRAKIPLNTIPASGMTMWYSLDKKHKVMRQGVIKIRMMFSSEKNSRVAAQEHRHLLKLLLLHELENSKVAPYWWSGTFSNRADAIITQHIAQSGLLKQELALAQWSVYTSVHVNHALSFTLFHNLIDKLHHPVMNNTICEESIKLFWDGVRKLLPSVLAVVRKIRRRTSNDKNSIKQLHDALSIINKLKTLSIPDGFDLLPKKQYQWYHGSNDDSPVNLVQVVEAAVACGANEWFAHCLEVQPKEETDVGKLQYFIKVLQLIRADLQKAIEFYERLFNEHLQFSFSKCLYGIYQEKIVELMQRDVETICKSLKRLSYNNITPNSSDISEPLTAGTSLFELYLVIQRFVKLGQGLYPTDFDTLSIKNYCNWFYDGVAQWLDIAVFKALLRIEKAVDLDNLKPIDANVKYSSSAVDTRTIFYQIKVFWEQLSWPDVEGCYTFIAKIIDDICRCCVFYADKMPSRIDGLGTIKTVYEDKFEVTPEWCLAVNNIDVVHQSLIPFTNELGIDEVMEKLADATSPLEAQRCRQTLDNVVLNALDTVKNKIIELLEIVIDKMCPSIKRLLIEGAELYQQDNQSVDRIMRYIDDNLATLHAELNEDNFNKVLAIIWDRVNGILKDIIQSSIEKRRPPSFYSNLHETLKLMLKSFKTEDGPCPELELTERTLMLNGLETPDLIHQVHIDLHKDQMNAKNSPFGQLTVRVKFHNSDLHVEVINGRNLAATDSNGLCDSFVRIHCLPEEKFCGIMKPKTQTHSKNRFPLYDETFTIPLSSELRGTESALLMFSVKDYDLLGYNNQYIGEAFISFKDIPSTTNDLHDMPQIHLELIRPSNLNTEPINILENRQDKQAKEFLKKLRQRLGTAGNSNGANN